MAAASVTLPAVDTNALIATLERARVPGESALVFDGDGTLWAGDVSEDTFHYAITRGLLRQDARAALEADARAHGLKPAGTASEIAGASFEAYRAGRYPERDVCAMMTWCYAGFTATELAELARAAFAESGLASRLNRALEPVVEWARVSGLRVVIVSASPRGIVEEAGALWSFSPGDIAASTPAMGAARIAPRLAGDVPYAEHKIPAARSVIDRADWLASFGDNLFDEAMLLEARVGVAVRPKPALRARLPGLPGIVLFDS